MPGSLVTTGNLGADAIVDTDADKIHFTSMIEGTGAPVADPPVVTKSWVYCDKAEDPVELYIWDTNAEEWLAAGTATTPTPDPGVSVVMVTQGPGDILTTGDGKWFFTVPDRLDGYVISAVNAALPGTPSSSGTVTVQLARVRAGVAVDVLSTAVTIDATEASSYTAATPSVVNAANDDVVEGDFLRVDVDGAGTDSAGLQVIVDFTEAP